MLINYQTDNVSTELHLTAVNVCRETGASYRLSSSDMYECNSVFICAVLFS